MNIRIKYFLLLALSSSCVVLVGCEKQDGKVTNKSPSEPLDRIGQINSRYQGSIDYARAQQNLRYGEPYIINDKIQISSGVLVKEFARINSDKTRSFGSQSLLQHVDCQNYSLKIGDSDWEDAEAGLMSGQMAYTVCHLPASEY
jgi:hypothetical protein